MELLEMLKVILLGIIQSITEWLPISSTGHMLLFDGLVPLQVSAEFKEVFLVLIQLGSIMAVVVLYFKKLNPFSRLHTPTERNRIYNIWFKVIIGSIPAGVVGVLFDDVIDSLFYNSVVVIAIALITYGVAFIVIEHFNKKKTAKVNDIADMSYFDAFKIGCFQMLALVPGTSRSGSTIIGAMLIGVNRFTAAEFSFFLAVPAMAGASLIKMLKFGWNFSSNELVILVMGMIVAFVGSIIVIRFLLDYVKRHDFKLFGYYRIILGLIVIAYFFLLR
ncbi:MAG: undecaprenyl-diphosphate phosphatase [Erysipelotrichaceae bacterium]|nr:undecaprenyl-diphosphate phosphatase [Erysipelotrichaceae bacterium]